MRNGMFVGMAIGLVTGAVLVSNNMKARKLVTDAQQQITSKVNQGIQNMQQNAQPEESAMQDNWQ